MPQGAIMPDGGARASDGDDGPVALPRFAVDAVPGSGERLVAHLQVGGVDGRPATLSPRLPRLRDHGRLDERSDHAHQDEHHRRGRGWEGPEPAGARGRREAAAVDAAHANLIGIELIVSEAVCDGLAADERRRWHPHGYEILGGSLVAPGLPAAAEQALLRRLMSSYGTTWPTGRHDVGGGHDLPLGEPTLMWSFDRDGETDPALEEDRAAVMGLDPIATRARRQELLPLAHPQRGVDRMRDRFPHATPIPGVVDADEADPRG